MFLGRKAELETLARAYTSSRSELVPIYGRRRVGKSELILHFIEDKPAVYYLGKTSAAQLQIQEFLQESARSLAEPLLADISAEEWKRALLAVVERSRAGGKLVLVFDEFQWMVAASPELPSVLQECWDRHWQKTGKVMLILCGSYVGFMEREVLGKKSPLFGRRTAQILLKPFAYREAAEFHPRWALADRARAYFICGGVPLYLRMFDPAARSSRTSRPHCSTSSHPCIASRTSSCAKSCAMSRTITRFCGQSRPEKPGAATSPLTRE